MTIMALIIGFAFGYTGCRIFVAQLAIKAAYGRGYRQAAAELRAWLLQLPQPLKAHVEANMTAWALNAVKALLDKTGDH